MPTNHRAAELCQSPLPDWHGVIVPWDGKANEDRHVYAIDFVVVG